MREIVTGLAGIEFEKGAVLRLISHMIPRCFFRCLAFVFVSGVLTIGLRAQTLTIQGVSDRANYRDSAAFRVVTNAGFTYEVTLNGVPVPAGVTNRVLIMDYYDLAVRRTQISDSSVTNVLVRFIVESSRRLKAGDSTSPEFGLLEWIPLKPIPSTTAEIIGLGGRLHLMMPSQFPANLEIPVTVRMEDHLGAQTRRVNGWVTNNGVVAPPFRLLRGVGHGFLPAQLPGSFQYTAWLQSAIPSNRTVTVEATTTWTPVSGVLGATTTWPADSRILVTSNLTIPAGGSLDIGPGTVVLLNPGVNITNSGRTVIDGTIHQPVVFTATNRVAPEQRAGAWGGWIMRGGELIANATIMTGSGAAASMSFSPGSSHRSEQPLIFAHNSVVRMTNCALINLAGQVGNGYRSTINWDHCLIQRAITCGEYDGGTNIISHSAVIEFPSVDGVYSATIADADYDGLYTINTTNYFEHSLFGFCKDDAIDAGSGGAGSVVLTNCWVESALHEALAWSGLGRRTWTYDTVLINSGQGLECGWSEGADSPLVRGERVLSTANCVGTRYGDNYTGTTGLGLKNGFLTATNSLFLYNYRDVWGQVWDNTWNWRTARMDVRGNWLTAPNTNHPDNSVWNAATDAPKLAPFMTTLPTAPVGIGLAAWPEQMSMAIFTNGLPVRLSSFTTLPVTVDYAVATPSGTLASGTLTFAPGETVRKIILAPAAVQGVELLQVSLSNPVGGEITGEAAAYVASPPPAPVTGTNTVLIAYGASWKYLDDGSNQGTAWKNPGFNDAAWASGQAQFGFGESDQATVIRRTNSAGLTNITFYFRKTVSGIVPSEFGDLALRLLRDDAGVVYFNGNEVYRSPNLPAAPAVIGYLTTATSTGENSVDQVTLSRTNLIAGSNLIAVEIHQESVTSSDVSFDLELIAGPPPASPQLYMAGFGTDLAFYWSDATFQLESSDVLPGNWMPVTGAVNPYVTQPAAAQRFYRLKKP